MDKARTTMRWSKDWFVKCDLEIAKYNFYLAQENGLMELFMLCHDLPDEITNKLMKQICVVSQKQELFCTGIK